MCTPPEFFPSEGINESSTKDRARSCYEKAGFNGGASGCPATWGENVWSEWLKLRKVPRSCCQKTDKLAVCVCCLSIVCFSGHFICMCLMSCLNREVADGLSSQVIPKSSPAEVLLSFRAVKNDDDAHVMLPAGIRYLSIKVSRRYRNGRSSEV